MHCFRFMFRNLYAFIFVLTLNIFCQQIENNEQKSSISACFPCSAAFYQCRTVTHCLLCVTLFLQKAFATCFYISDSLHFECRFAPPKCVRYLAPLITHVFLRVSSFLQKLFVNWLLHATHSLCASLCSFKSVRTLSRVPR